MQLGEHAVGRDDLIILGFIVMMVGSIGVMQLGDGEPTPERCKEYITAIENNITRQGFDVDCSCRSGDEAAQYLQTPEKVRNATSVAFAVSCDINGQEQTFLIREINSSEVLENESATVVQ